MRSAGQPPADRIVRVFPTRLCHRGGGAMTASARRPRKRVPCLAEAGSGFAISRSLIPTLRHPAARLLRRAEVEEAASPGNQSRWCAFLEVSPGNSLSRIAGCRWLCRNHPAESGTLTFRWTHSPLLCSSPQHKKCLPLCRSCGRSEFPVDTRGNL